MLRIVPFLIGVLPLLIVAPRMEAAPLSAVLGRAVAYTGGIEAVPKWQRLLVRLEREWSSYAACMEQPAACPSEGAARWGRLLRQLRDRPRAEQIAEVDRFANAFPYRTDPEVWGVSDYWATPWEFLARSGDCEDYAIFKYVSLRLLGVPAQAMRLLVVHDLRRNLPHAVLEVGDGAEALLLDNLTPRPWPAREARHYRPYYAASAMDVHFPRARNRRITLLRADQVRPAR